MGKFDSQGALRSLLREVEFKELALLEDRGSVGGNGGRDAELSSCRSITHIFHLRAEGDRKSQRTQPNKRRAVFLSLGIVSWRKSMKSKETRKAYMHI